jgi:hypothetical protein
MLLRDAFGRVFALLRLASGFFEDRSPKGSHRFKIHFDIRTSSVCCWGKSSEIANLNVDFHLYFFAMFLFNLFKNQATQDDTSSSQ